MKRAYLYVTVLAAMVALGSFAAYADDEVNAPFTAGPNFIDEDGDGFCDINPDGVKQQLRDGSGAGRKGYSGAGPNFVDADGDGVCDINPDGVKQQLRDGSGVGRASRNGAAKASVSGTAKSGGSGRRGGRSGK